MEIFKNLDFWVFLGFLRVWIWNGLILGGWLGGRVSNWVEMLSWIKIECKVTLKTRRHATWAPMWVDFKRHQNKADW